MNGRIIPIIFDLKHWQYCNTSISLVGKVAVADSAVSLVLSHAVSQGGERKDIYPMHDAQTHNVQTEVQIQIQMC